MRRKRPHPLTGTRVAHERATTAALSRTGAAYHLRKLTELASTLTAEQRQQLARLASGDTGGKTA